MSVVYDHRHVSWLVEKTFNTTEGAGIREYIDGLVERILQLQDEVGDECARAEQAEDKLADIRIAAWLSYGDGR